MPGADLRSAQIDFHDRLVARRRPLRPFGEPHACGGGIDPTLEDSALYPGSRSTAGVQHLTAERKGCGLPTGWPCDCLSVSMTIGKDVLGRQGFYQGSQPAGAQVSGESGLNQSGLSPNKTGLLRSCLLLCMQHFDRINFAIFGHAKILQPSSARLQLILKYPEADCA